MSLQAQSLVGLIVIPLIAWVLSERRAAIGPARLARLLRRRSRAAACHCRHHAERCCRARHVRLGGGNRDGAAIGDRRRRAARVRLSGGRPGAVPDRRPAQQLHTGVSCASVDPGDQRAHQALLPLGCAATRGPRHRLGAAAHARRVGAGRHVGRRQHLRRHGGGAAAGAALPRGHEPRRSVCHNDRRHGGRGRHGARRLCHHSAAGAAGRGGAPDRGLRDQRAGGAAAVGADGAAGVRRKRAPPQPAEGDADGS